MKEVERERARANPAIARGWMQDSDAPASITSTDAEGWETRRKASPRAWAPVVQAVVGAWFGPIRWYFMAMWDAAMLMRRRGTKRGETFLYPPWSAHVRMREAVRVVPNRKGERTLFKGYGSVVHVFEVTNAGSETDALLMVSW